MPEMDGYEFIDALRRLPKMVSVPAIALTGFGRAQDAKSALRAGFNAHLAKARIVACLTECDRSNKKRRNLK